MKLTTRSSRRRGGGGEGSRGSFAVILSLALGASMGTAGAPANPSPAERRGNALLEVIRKNDPVVLRKFLDEALDESFLEMAPLDVHVQESEEIRRTLGDFRVEEVRILEPDRADFLLRTSSHEVYVLHLETEPIEPHKLAGIGFRRHDPDLDIPEFSSLAEADRHLRELAERNAFSGVVLVDRPGQPEWAGAYGYADKEKSIRNTTATRFDLVSITKALTAVAVMQLADKGALDLSAPMGRYLEGFPPEIADRVTILHLLRMESGFGDYFSNSFMERRVKLRTVSDYLKLFATFALEFEPGTQRRYSNVGYVILGGIVERVSGVTYSEYVKRNIYDVAGMTGSSFRGATPDDGLTAIGYTRSHSPERGGYGEPNREILELGATPAGGSYSPAIDVPRFDRALRENRLMGESSTTFLLGRFGDVNERPAFRGVAGGAPGVSTISLEETAAGVTVIVLSNFDEPIAEDVGRRIFRLLTRGSGT